MSENGKVMAIMRRPKYGVEERAGVCLRFETYVAESSAAFQLLLPGEAAEVLMAYGVDDVAKLDGKPCWVDMSKSGMIGWVGPCVMR